MSFFPLHNGHSSVLSPEAAMHDGTVDGPVDFPTFPFAGDFNSQALPLHPDYFFGANNYVGSMLLFVNLLFS